MVVKPCAEHRCVRYAAPGRSRCPDHEREQQRNRRKSPSQQVTHSHRWRRLRERVLREHELPTGGWQCQWCQKTILDRTLVDLDHIRAVADGGAQFDPANLVPSCGRCNRGRKRTR
jgi:5-methylcytosine-specific restriction endonuclease McrA